MTNKPVTFPPGFNLYAFKQGNKNRIKLAKEKIVQIKAQGKVDLKTAKSEGKEEFDLEYISYCIESDRDEERKKIKGAKEQIKLLKDLRKSTHSFAGFPSLIKKGNLIATEKSAVAIQYEADKAAYRYRDMKTRGTLELRLELQKKAENANNWCQKDAKFQSSAAKTARREFKREWEKITTDVDIRNYKIGENKFRDDMSQLALTSEDIAAFRNRVALLFPPQGLGLQDSEEASIDPRQIPNQNNDQNSTICPLRENPENPQEFARNEIQYIRGIIGY